MKEIEIGKITIKKDTEFVDNGYECAAWYQKILVKAGTYPLYTTIRCECDDGTILCDMVRAVLPGTVVSDYFGSMLCGVPVGTYDGSKNAGKASEYHWGVHDFSFAEYVFTGFEDDTYRFEIDPAYAVREEKFNSSYDGAEMTTHRIYRAVA